MKLFLFVVAALSLCTSCKKSGVVSDVAPHSKEQQWFTQEDVGKAITAGMSREMLEKRFGKASLETKEQNDVICLMYLEPEQASSSRHYEFSGFQVFLQADHVIRWLPIHSSTVLRNETIERTSARSRTTDKIQPISVFALSDKAFQGGVYIDTPRFPKLGYINSGTPEMTITRIASLEEQDGSQVKDGTQVVVKYLNIVLTEKDAEALRSLTANHQGRRILVQIGNVPVSAPRVAGPLDTGRLSLTFSDDLTAFKDLKTALEKMVSP